MDEGRLARSGTDPEKLTPDPSELAGTDDPADTGAPAGIARGSMTVAAWTLISRFTGLLRVVVIGAVLGPTFFANAFLAANTVPNLIYMVLAGPVLALVLVPALTHALTERGLASSRLLLSRTTGYLMFWASLLAGAIMLASPLVALALTAGVPGDAERWRAWRLTVLIIVFVAPQVVGYALASIGAAVQQTRRRFALSSAAPALENLVMVATMGVVALLYRPGLEVGEVPVSMVVVLGLGATLSVAVHAAAQLFGAARVGLPIRPKRGWSRDPEAREVSQRLRQSVAVAAFPVGSVFVLLAVAATVPGGVFVVDTALTVYAVVGALGAKAVTVAALPGMSAAARNGSTQPLGAAWRQALNLSVMASLPAMCLLIAFAQPVASTLANGALDTHTIVSWLSAGVMVLAVSQVANALYEVSRQTLFARLDTGGPRRAVTAMTVVRIVVSLACLLVPPGGDRLTGLCVAVLLGDVAAATVGLYLVRKALAPERLWDVRTLGIITAATVATLPAAVFGWWLLREHVHGKLPQVAVGLAMGAVAMACFAVVYALLSGQFPALIERARAVLVRGRQDKKAQGADREH